MLGILSVTAALIVFFQQRERRVYVLRIISMAVICFCAGAFLFHFTHGIQYSTAVKRFLHVFTTSLPHP